MNILLWVLQGVLAWLAFAGGAYQIIQFGELKKGVNAMRKLPRGIWAFLGTVGCIGGLGLILPGVFSFLPELTVLSAILLTVQSLVISALYLIYRDRAPLPYSLVMAFLAAMIALGRFTHQ